MGDQPTVEQKLAALRKLGDMLGMFSERSSEQAREVRQSLDRSFILSAMMGVIFSDHPYQRTACGFLLDFAFPGWRDGAPAEALGFVAQRSDAVVGAWRKQVLSRDRVCQHCGSNDSLDAHHVVRWADAPELRLSPANGIALCRPCHGLEHGQRWKRRAGLQR